MGPQALALITQAAGTVARCRSTVKPLIKQC